jgi:hypothetical protein
MTAVGSAAEAHDGMVAAYHAQRERLWPSADMWSGSASNFKPDFSAPLNAVQQYVAEHVHKSDVLLDVGGGAGRMSLPLAGACVEVICVDPSLGMAEGFEASARDGGITNARFVRSDWLDADGLEGDVVLVSHVTYFVPTIKPFLAKLASATRRRAIIATHSVPPPNRWAPFVELATGEVQSPVPGAEHILAVLNDLSLPAQLVDLDDVRLTVTAPPGKTPEEAIKLQANSGLRLGWLREERVATFIDVVRSRFNELFVRTDDGYLPKMLLGTRDLVITWETGR